MSALDAMPTTVTPTPSSTETPVRRHIRRLCVTVAAAALLAGCADNAPQDTFKPKGPNADDIDGLARVVGTIAIVVGVLVAVALLTVIIKFRARKGHEMDVPTQVHGNTVLELGWTIAPAVLLAGIAVPTVSLVFDLAEKPSDALVVDVVGQQWWWEMSYPADVAPNAAEGISAPIVTANVLVMPVGRPVYLRITSRDVIHSFWVPALNGKKDAVPGRTHYLTLEASEPGEFWGQCAEFCGLSHANMRIRAYALSEADWDEWVADQQLPAAAPATQEATRGLEVFQQKGCAGCHDIAGVNSAADVPLVAGAAPSLTHLMSRNVFAGALFDLRTPECPVTPATPSGTPVECLNRADLEEWLRDPPGAKPMYAQGGRGMPDLGLTEDEIDALVAYLSTLK